MQNNVTQHNAKYAMHWLIIMAPAILFLWLVWRYSENFPVHDDFDTPIKDLLLWFQTSSIKERAYIFFKFHSDHRLAYLRLVSLLVMSVNGGVLNFKMITIFNSLLFVITFWWLVKPIVSRVGLRLLAAGVFLFTMNFYDAMLWAHVSANYSPMLFFVTLLAYCLVYIESPVFRFLSALFLSIAASMILGNGIFAWLVVLCYVLLQRKWLHALVWILLTAVFYYLYFLGYNRAVYLGQAYNPLANMANKAIGFFALHGNAFIIEMSHLKLATALGILFVAFLVFFLIRTWKKERGHLSRETWFYLLVISFLMLTLAAISLGRVGDAASFQYLLEASRYKFYSTAIVVVAYLLFIANYELKSLPSVLLLSATLLFSCYSFFCLKRHIDYELKSYDCARFNWARNKSGLKYYLGFEEIANTNFDEFIRKGFFVCNTSRTSWELLDLNKSAYEDQAIALRRDSTIRHFGDMKVVDNQILIDNKGLSMSSDRLSGYYVLLKSDNNLYKFPGLANKNHGRNFLKNGPGFKVSINEKHLKKGDYHIYSLYQYGKKQIVKKTGLHVVM